MSFWSICLANGIISLTHRRLVRSLLGKWVDFELELRILGRFFSRYLTDPARKGETHVVLMGSWIGWQVKVEALLKVVHSVTHAVPKVDRRKMLRRTGECDVCTANGVGCLGQVLWSKAPQR